MTPLASGLPDQVRDDEDIARFLTQSGHFSKSKVDPSAFLPGRKDKETSVARHGREPTAALRSLGTAAANGRNLYGAAMIKGRDVRRASLEVLPDEPPERHAVIRGWPWIDGDPQLQKAQQKERAIVLADAAGEPLLFS